MLQDGDDVRVILESCTMANIPVRTFTKHDLNMLTDSRPHQGLVLRAAPLEISRTKVLDPVDSFRCVVALDSITDPQNLGAILRSCHFLGAGGVILCTKNSSPLSPVVSKASAGALEIMPISEVNNMMRFLDSSKSNGWQVVGTSISDRAVELPRVPTTKPTILVLGNEGHGIRTNILNRCDHLVKIPRGNKSPSVLDRVDSLNVSVGGGIILYHMLSKGSL